MNDLDLSSLRDRLSAVEIVDRLFVAVDRKDWETVREIFSPRVHFDMTSLAGGSPSVVDREQILGGWKEGLKDVAFIHHQSGNHLVTLRGDRADVFCYGIAIHHRPEAEKKTTTFVGSYQIELERGGASWVVVAFKFDKKWVE
jgi:hypothetical protein